RILARTSVAGVAPAIVCGPVLFCCRTGLCQMTLLVVCLARRGVIEAGFFLSALLCPLAAAAGTFQPNVNASSSPRIYNASEINEDWLGYSCASIGGKGT
ncbi:unnamed protein product, partial [Ectocarpus sp. 12 AP-2014]